MSLKGVRFNRTLINVSNLEIVQEPVQISAKATTDEQIHLSPKTSVSPQICISSTTPQCPYPWFEDTKPTMKPSDFSIEHILHCAGNQHKTSSSQTTEGPTLFDWLQCTRYRPPKLQRVRRKDTSCRRKLGRNPRIPFSGSQVAVLEDRFRISPYLSSSDVAHLSTLLRLSDTRIKIWFQNRRARERRDKDGNLDRHHHTKDDSLLSKTPHLKNFLHKQEITRSAFTPITSH